MALQTATIGRLCSLFTQGSDPILLLGAGASVTSGIPLAGDMVEKIARWGYCKDNGRSVEDPRIRRSDWHPWLKKQDWYREDWKQADNYPFAVEKVLIPLVARREFFLNILNTQVQPSSGYEHIVELMARKRVRTVLTTNFDTILPKLCSSNPRLHHVELIQTTSDFTTISTAPQHPQLIYLHGSVEHYTDKNTLEQIKDPLDADLVSELMPLLSDHPLIVIGYRGAEPSVMQHLLIKSAAAANNYRNGIYWCVRHYERKESDSLAPLVHEFAEHISPNFQVIPIDGFDAVMETLWNHVRYQPSDVVQGQMTVYSEPSIIPSYDLRPITASSLNDFEWPPMRVRLLQYCERTDIQVPSVRNDDWFTQLLCDQDLASRTEEENIFPTVGGYLLFAEIPQSHIQTAQIVVHLKGPTEWLENVFNVFGEQAELVIEGNLWVQLEEIYVLLSGVNRSFLLKEGRHSKSVYPYPPDALREIVVNALVHRDYEKDEPILIEIEQTYIRVRNPGGLVQDVITQIRDIPQEEIKNAFEKEIRGGVRGIRGYRNPVVADMFYGAAEMEKVGSGLSDVWLESEKNENTVNFGPIDNNTAFEVKISRRPEVIDDVTGTASSTTNFTRYASNLLEVVSLPDAIWYAGTEARRAKEVWEKTEADWLPPFMTYSRQLFTFHDISRSANPLYAVIDTNGVGKMAIEEFTNIYGERCFVWLLNECFYRHLEAQGLWVDKDRMRAYFPRTDKGTRKINYQAPLRRATRTVVKRRKNYWEHQSFWFRFERFGDVWTLVILPSYVFTTDGKKALLQGDLVNKLSTQRQSRDYNNATHNDLVFWTWVLSEGKHGTFALNTEPANVQSDGNRIRVRTNLSAAVASDFGDEAWGIEPVKESDAELAQLESEFSETVSQLVEEANANSNGSHPITNT
ncbi:MAG: SIR2 family protein [Candidatus Poribacteria bacterium]|nr:SIR2 family protein [Candidatus Poribacteria bacterium]